MAAPASDPKKVFVGQFPKETTEDEIRRLFPGLDVTEIEFAAARS
jgi:RNA recognition motif-containing protein